MKRSAGLFAFILGAQGVLVALSVARLFGSRESVVGRFECFTCQAATVLQHDAGLWAAAWALLLLATVPPRLLRGTAVAAALVLIALLAADIVVLQRFGLRLYLPDLLTYGQQPRFVIGYLLELPWWQWLPGLAALAALPWLLYRASGHLLARPVARTALAAMVALSLLLYALPDRGASPLPWTYQNLLEANWPSGADRAFSNDYLETLLAAPPAALTERICETGLDRGGDVIVVALESWSWYHSALLLENALNATPGLDALAREHAWWDRFLANGFTTDHGLIALLGGQLPVPAVNRYRSLDVFAGYTGDWRALPRRLGDDGYFTAFLTSGHLGFLNKGAWLENLGFDHVEGHDQAAYEGARRYQFAAVSDELLYARVLDWLARERPQERPIAAFIETVSTHPPFTDPISGVSDEAATFRFADAALTDFIRSLDQRGYFRDGLLVITSDQRALTPLRQDELAAFGAQSGARLPLLMLGDRLNLQGRQSIAGQMLDLPFSLDFYLTDEACRLPGQGNLFTGKAPECIFQPDGNRRSVIHAFCGDHHAQILMDGDDTRVIDGYLPNADLRLRALNFQRARLGVQSVNAHNVL